MTLACNLNAIDAATRPRYTKLLDLLRSALRERTELPDGFAYRLNGTDVTLPEIAEWISLERLCCPFLTLQLETSGREPDWHLKLTGPAGVKELLAHFL